MTTGVSWLRPNSVSKCVSADRSIVDRALTASVILLAVFSPSRTSSQSLAVLLYKYNPVIDFFDLNMLLYLTAKSGRGVEDPKLFGQLFTDSRSPAFVDIRFHPTHDYLSTMLQSL